MKILFLCSRNKRRSLTAERIFSGSSRFQVRSAGTEDSARVKVTDGLVGWADIIFVMEKRHRTRLYDKCPIARDKEVIILDIPDDFKFMDETLAEMLKTAVEDRLGPV